MRDLIISKIKSLIQSAPGKWGTTAVCRGQPIHKLRLDMLSDEELVDTLINVTKHAVKPVPQQW